MDDELTCNQCGEAVPKLTAGRCDLCWDDLAKGRDWRKRKKLTEPTPDGERWNAGKVGDFLKALEGMGVPARELAQKFREAGEKFGDVQPKVEPDLYDRLFRMEPDALQELLEQRYLSNSPVNWKKLAEPRKKEPETVQYQKDPKYRTSPYPSIGGFGEIIEQVEPDLGSNGKPIPGKAYRDAYLQTNPCPPNWPEYDAARKKDETTCILEGSMFKDYGPVDREIVGVDQRGLLQVRTDRGYRYVEPESYGMEATLDTPSKIVARYHVANGVDHTAILTPTQLAGLHNWLRNRGQDQEQNAKVPPFDPPAIGIKGQTYEVVKVWPDGRLEAKNLKSGQHIFLDGELVNNTTSELVYDYNLGGGAKYRGTVSHADVQAYYDGAKKAVQDLEDKLEPEAIETPGERVARQLKETER